MQFKVKKNLKKRLITNLLNNKKLNNQKINTKYIDYKKIVNKSTKTLNKMKNWLNMFLTKMSINGINSLKIKCLILYNKGSFKIK